MTAKRFDPDVYKDRKNLRNRDFAAGFSGAGLFWVLLFHPFWFLAPIMITGASLAGIFSQKIKRRYVLYGALSLVFLPLVIYAFILVGYKGRNEVK